MAADWGGRGWRNIWLQSWIVSKTAVRYAAWAYLCGSIIVPYLCGTLALLCHCTYLCVSLMLNTLRLIGCTHRGGLSWSLMNVYIFSYISIHTITNSFPEYICMGHQHCAWLVILSEVVWIPTARLHCCQLTCTQLQLHTHHVYDNIR